MYFIHDYCSLLPDLNNFILSFIPSITYFISAKFYSHFHKEIKSPADESISNSTKNMISTVPGNIFIVYPLFNYFSSIEGIYFMNIILSVFIIDTVEYFCHYLYHRISFFYNNIHNVHHKPVTVSPLTSFTNHDREALLTSSIILLFLVYSALTFYEYIIAVCLSFSSTVCDHTSTSKKKFHYIHHHVNKNKNFQQPFFTYWDHIFGTYYKGSELKIPFVP